jgi:RNA polymerase sigma-70 factor (ECF subfamily)
MDDTDFDFLDRWCGGDAAAGSLLFNRHFNTLYKFFEHKVIGDVDDLVQETLLECVKSRDAFKRKSTFRTYLFAIARNVLLQYWRRKASLRPTVDFEEVSIESLSTSVGSRLAKQSERARLIAVLRMLPMEQQMLLEMFYWEGFDRSQLAEIFEVEAATIGSRLHRARQAMKVLLESASHDLGPPPADLDSWARSLAHDERSG